MKAVRIASALTLLLAASQAWAVKPFVADYEASWKGVQANAQISLNRGSDNRWNYELSVSNQLGSSRQTTVFEEHGAGFRPLSGVDATQVLFKRSQKNATYDWAQREAHWSGDVKADRAGPVKLEDGDLDGMLINLALVRDVAAGKPLNYRMVDDGRVKTLTYRVVGKENMTVDGKTVEATKVSRVDGNKEQIAWIAPGMPVPVRLLQREGGRDALDLTIKSLR